jgi:hypothetical protein
LPSALGEIEGTQGAVWKRRWITAVVLLRTLADVLHEVDVELSEEHRQVINKWWAELVKRQPTPEI